MSLKKRIYYKNDINDESDVDKLYNKKDKFRIIRNSISNKINPNINKNNNININNNSNETTLSISSETDTDDNITFYLNNNSNLSFSSDEEKITSSEISPLKFQELKCISVITNLILKSKEISTKKEEKKLNELNVMDISDDENKNDINNNIKFLPCRYFEQKIIYDYIKKGLNISNMSYEPLYICGMCGTGKTESVKKVIKIIEQESSLNNNINPFRYFYINCVNFSTNMKLIKSIYNFIFSKKLGDIKVSNYLNILDDFFNKRNDYNGNIYLNDPSNSHIILILDEIDYLIDKFQILLYNIYNWASYQNSKLIIISISNKVNISDYFWKKIASRFGFNKLMLKPYTKEQIREIINYQGINLNKFDENALKLTAMKVSAINGDLRRVILILKHSINIFNNEMNSNNKDILINKNYIIKAYNDLFGSKIIKLLKNLKIIEKILLGSIIYIMNNNKDINNNANFVKIEKIYETIDILINKYNEKNLNNNKIELDVNWDEFMIVMNNLIRMKIIEIIEDENDNFKDKFVNINFYIDEFFYGCEKDDDFEPIYNFLLSQ